MKNKKNKIKKTQLIKITINNLLVEDEILKKNNIISINVQETQYKSINEDWTCVDFIIHKDQAYFTFSKLKKTFIGYPKQIEKKVIIPANCILDIEHVY